MRDDPCSLTLTRTALNKNYKVLDSQAALWPTTYVAVLRKLSTHLKEGVCLKIKF